MKTLLASVVVAAVVLGSAMSSTSEAHWRGGWGYYGGGWGYGAYYRPYAYRSYGYSPAYGYGYGYAPTYSYTYSPYWRTSYYGGYSPYGCGYGYGYYGW